MDRWPGLTPDYIDDRMLYRDFCLLCEEIDLAAAAARKQRRGPPDG